MKTIHFSTKIGRNFNLILRNDINFLKLHSKNSIYFLSIINKILLEILLHSVITVITVVKVNLFLIKLILNLMKN